MDKKVARWWILCSHAPFVLAGTITAAVICPPLWWVGTVGGYYLSRDFWKTPFYM